MPVRNAIPENAARVEGNSLCWGLSPVLHSRKCGGAEGCTKGLVRDIATISGVRDNPLIGYGIVVGLHGTGDSQQTGIFTVQALTSALHKFGVQAPAASITVKNVAAVFVTASLPPFCQPGTLP